MDDGGGKWAVRKASKKNKSKLDDVGGGARNSVFQENNGNGFNTKPKKSLRPGKLQPINSDGGGMLTSPRYAVLHGGGPGSPVSNGMDKSRRSISTGRDRESVDVGSRAPFKKGAAKTGGRPGSEEGRLLPPIKGANRSLRGLIGDPNENPNTRGTLPSSRTPPPNLGATASPRGDLTSKSEMVSHTPDPVMHHHLTPTTRRDTVGPLDRSALGASERRSSERELPSLRRSISGPLLSEGDDTDGYVTGREDGARKEKKSRIRVVCRKRPLPEDADVEEDVVLINTPECHISTTKLRVDLSEYTENHSYVFDESIDEKSSNEDVYSSCARTLIDCVFDGGSASCFAYGQTGSGKTHTMIGSETEPGMYILAANDIFERAQPQHRVFVSLYEIYCNSLFDLLNHRAVVVPREDANKRVNVCGLTWHEIASVKDLIRVIDRGTVQRRTGSTSANEFSSRSHAVLTITLRDENSPKFFGSLNVVDLAGSERAADTACNDKQTRLEGAEINKSLLALKECIRGLDERKKHIPFRGSKLTEVLRDNFVGNSQTVMIATVSARAVDVEHTLNTLRYAFRVKGLSVEMTAPSVARRAPPPPKQAPTPSPLMPAGGAGPLAVSMANDDWKKKEKPRKRRSEKEDREKKKRVVAPSPTPRMGYGMEKSMVDLESIIESKLASKFEELARQNAKKDANIDTLVEQNRKLLEQNDELRRMMTYREPTLADD